MRFGNRRTVLMEPPVASMPPARATQATFEELVRGPERRSNLVEAALDRTTSPPVSYTHLTLPTIYSV